jgi:hypothetical protein
LWTVFQKDFKDLVWEDGVVVVYVVVDVLCVYVKSFQYVQVGGLFCGVLVSAWCFG